MTPEQPDTAVSTGLTRESARIVRAERIVASAEKLETRALMRGYFDQMLGLSKPEWITPEIEPVYLEGASKCSAMVAIFRARGYDWEWYCESYLQMSEEIREKFSGSS